MSSGTGAVAGEGGVGSGAGATVGTSGAETGGAETVWAGTASGLACMAVNINAVVNPETPTQKIPSPRNCGVAA
jgi:hypothetical protein